MKLERAAATPPVCAGAGCVGFWPPLMMGCLHTPVRKGLGISAELAVLSPAATTTDPS